MWLKQTFLSTYLYTVYTQQLLKKCDKMFIFSVTFQISIMSILDTVLDNEKTNFMAFLSGQYRTSKYIARKVGTMI